MEGRNLTTFAMPIFDKAVRLNIFLKNLYFYKQLKTYRESIVRRVTLGHFTRRLNFSYGFQNYNAKILLKLMQRTKKFKVLVTRHRNLSILHFQDIVFKDL